MKYIRTRNGLLWRYKLMKKLEFDSWKEMIDYVEFHISEYDYGEKVVIHNAQFLKTDEPHDIYIRIYQTKHKDFEIEQAVEWVEMDITEEKAIPLKGEWK